MLKRFLFTLLTLLFFISVPCESFAAPRKESRKERRERKKKRKNAKVKKTVKKKVTPTLEENLSPAQVERKIQTIRKRVEMASEDSIPAEYKPILLEVFDDMAKTQMGRYIFEKAHPDLNFRIRSIGGNALASYSFGSRTVNLPKNIFEPIYKNTYPKETNRLRRLIAQHIAHEATHSIHHVNNLTTKSNQSLKERVSFALLCEAHCFLNADIVNLQITKHPKLHSDLPERSLFYKELFDAYKTIGLPDKQAHRGASTKIIETIWKNDGKNPIHIGEKTILPCDESIRNFYSGYMRYEFGKFSRSGTPLHSTANAKNSDATLQRLINLMEINTPISFFKDPKTTSFDILDPHRIITYENGIKREELNVLTTCLRYKAYHQGNLSYLLFVRPQKGQNKSYVEYHRGTKVKRATYTYENGKINGIYREYDKNGQQTMEIPVVDNLSDGEGWLIEDLKRINVHFRRGRIMKITNPD